jgi:CSLREA domain-containing protein
MRRRLPAIRVFWPRVFGIPFFVLLVVTSALSAQTTFTVNATDDANDGTCDATHCSLREAITAANQIEGEKLIAFDIAGPAPHTIRPTSGLPSIESGVTLDGTTEPDFAGSPVVELDGSIAGTAHGLSIVLSNNTIRGLVINRFALNGIAVETDATANVIEGCYIGTDVAGSAALGNGNAGVLIGQARDNTVGGSSAAQRNVISGNIEGVTIVDVTATGNRVIGNYIGTNASGDAAIPNNVGVLLLAPDNTVGGAAAGEGNVISGNTFSGVDLWSPDATGNVVLGNHIGLDATGSVAIANEMGVRLNDAANNTIGGTAAGARNLISGNTGIGVLFLGADASGNVVQGNYIGTDVRGREAIPNHSGVLLWSPDNTIGGTAAGAGNVISGNTFAGIDMGEDTRGTVIQGNYIGTDATGSMQLGNALGIFVNHAPDNTIGGPGAGAANVISGNFGDAIHVNGPKATGTLIHGNYIGANPEGQDWVGNYGTGITLFDGASGTIIGGAASGAGNIIAHNGAKGVVLQPDAGTGNVIRGNAIFGNNQLAIDLGNDGSTPNDPGDEDTGPNEYQNYPTLSARRTGSGAAVTAELDSRPGGTYAIEVFSNDACEPSQTGNATVLVSTAALTTDASGHGSVSVTVGDVGAEAVLAATATDADGNTSELGTCAELSDFEVEIAPWTRIVTPGESVAYSVTVSAERGSFDAAVALSCSGLPSGAQCSFSESEVTPGSGESVSTMTVSTTAPSSALLAPVPGASRWRRPWSGEGSSPVLPGIWVVMLFVAGAGLVLVRTRGRLVRWGRVLLGGLVLAAVLQVGCGDGDGGTEPLPPTGGTPTGSYEITVSGTVGSLVHTATTNLTVE